MRSLKASSLLTLSEQVSTFLGGEGSDVEGSSFSWRVPWGSGSRPKFKNEGEVFKDEWYAVLNAKRKSLRLTSHLRCVSLMNEIIIVFNARLIRSTGFACGWYGDVLARSIAYSWQIWSTIFLQNSVPLSVNKNFDVSQRFITRSLNALVMVAPFAFLKGRTSIYRVKKSWKTRK